MWCLSCRIFTCRTFRKPILIALLAMLMIEPQGVSCFLTSSVGRKQVLQIKIGQEFYRHGKEARILNKGRNISLILGEDKKGEGGLNGEALLNGRQQKNNRNNTKKSRDKKRDLPRKAVVIYRDYFTQLWTDTNIEARKRVAKDKAASAIRNVEHVFKNENNLDFSEEESTAARNLIDACHGMVEVMASHDHGKGEKAEVSAIDSEKEALAVSETAASISNDGSSNNKKKKSRSVMFGTLMGAAVACWVFSGNYIFTGLFTLMTILGQLEYYRMVMNTGVYPARRISVIGAASMFLTALVAPNLHQICLPMFGLWAMIWFLTMRRQITPIQEIATTFTGMFYLGYIPSFWVRTRLIGGGIEPTRLAPLVGPLLERIGQSAAALPAFVPQAVHLPITTGAIFIFWTWLCLAFSDVGAYFVGRKYGRTKLSKVSPAAGLTSPNKTVEGVLGACVVSGGLGVLGAWVQKWPYFAVTGSIHGVLLALLGLVGDLTASMIKRDAGIKDFGDLIPEHGGILDRVDSFVFSAPYSWLVCSYIIPALKKFVKAKALSPV